jgi:hypothetical protein
MQTVAAAADIHDDEFHKGKIYCANCIHCKLVPVERVRCAAGKWKKKLGEEKFYRYGTITRRFLDYCEAYDEMGDTRSFIRELRKSLDKAPLEPVPEDAD